MPARAAVPAAWLLVLLLPLHAFGVAFLPAWMPAHRHQSDTPRAAPQLVARQMGVLRTRAHAVVAPAPSIRPKPMATSRETERRDIALHALSRHEHGGPPDLHNDTGAHTHEARRSAHSHPNAAPRNAARDHAVNHSRHTPGHGLPGELHDETTTHSHEAPLAAHPHPHPHIATREFADRDSTVNAQRIHRQSGAAHRQSEAGAAQQVSGQVAPRQPKAVAAAPRSEAPIAITPHDITPHNHATIGRHHHGDDPRGARTMVLVSQSVADQADALPARGGWDTPWPLMPVRRRLPACGAEASPHADATRCSPAPALAGLLRPPRHVS